MSLEKLPELGSKPVHLSVKMPPMKKQGGAGLGAGMRELYQRGELTDVFLTCAERSFHAHRAVLASRSEVFKQGLAAKDASSTGVDGGKQEVRLADIQNPEAVKFMLDYLYEMDSDMWEDYNPQTQEVTKDVLRLAQNFRLPGLTERAVHWLAKDITTGNVVERLTICEDFECAVLQGKIIEQLTNNKKALAEVANSQQIMNHPKLMKALLQHAAAVPDDDPQPKKRGRKV